MTPRFGALRRSTAALALVLASVIGGVYLASRALDAADQRHAQAEAQIAASSIGDLLAANERTLTMLAVLARDGADSAQLAHAAMGGNTTTSFSFVEVCRPSRVRGESSKCTRVVGQRDSSRAKRELPLVHSLARLGETESMGIVNAAIPFDLLRSALVGKVDQRARRISLISGTDTIATAALPGDMPRNLRIEEAEVHFPGGARTTPVFARVEVGPGSPTVRWAVWLIALGSILGLTLAVRSERRELRRATNRTQELQQVSDELLRANRAKNEFLANVSHELRTPLNAIVGFTELLREGVYGELTGRQAPPVERIEASANHLRGLVDQILDLAKIAAGRLDVHQERIDLRSFVLDVVTEVEPLVNEKGLTLSIAVGATLPKLRTDPSHLRAILLNLVGNAIKFTERGTIAVRARLATGSLPNSDRMRLSPALGSDLEKIRAVAASEPLNWVAVQVVDSGVGIAPRDRERVFDEFEQVGSAGRGDSMRRGTGLGLTISRRLARLLGGDLTVESEVGMGSTFTIWLPVEKGSATS